MNANLDKIAQDLYGKIKTRFPNIKMGDENAGVLSKKDDIPKARFFEFEYEENGEPLGTIAITLDETDGIVLQVSGDLVNDNDNTTHHGAYKFVRGFRQFAKDRLLNFDVQNIGKSNLDKRDYQFQAKRKENAMPAIMENKMYGNARMSYQDIGENARLVVKHTQPINMELAAGRTMHIDSIYIENAQGERFRYPAKHLNGARALAEHIKAGGNPYDLIGKHICSLSEELASLRKFKGYVSRQEQVSEAMGGVTDRVLERIEQIKETIHKLQRPAYYQAFVESFEEQEEHMIPEEIQNDLIDRLTIRTFNEELKAVFPYIYKFVDESELPVLEIGADDLLDEVFDDDKETGTTHQGGKVTKTANGIKHEKRYPDSFDNTDDYDDHAGAERYAIGGPKKHHFKRSTPESQFENFMNRIVSEDRDEIFSPNKDAQQTAIEKLNKILSQPLKGGPNGTNAVQSLKGVIDDPEFLQKLQDIDPELDIRPLIQEYILDRDPEVAVQLDFSGEETTTPEPEAPAPAEPAPTPAPAEPAPAEPAPAEAPAPVAEATDTVEKDADGNVKSWKHEGDWKKADKKDPRGKVTNASGQALKKTIAIAKKAGATLETQLDFGHKVMTLGEAIKECGMSPEEVGFAPESGLPAMLKYISGFYNKDEGNFPLGGMRVKIKVKKAAEDGEFGDVNPAELIKVLKFIDAKDPSDEINHHEQQHVLKLAGVANGVLPTETPQDIPNVHADKLGQELGGLARILKLARG
jgi:hypothetical protein